jgi:hypothetical protein
MFRPILFNIKWLDHAKETLHSYCKLGEREKKYETLATSLSRDQTQDPDNTKEFTLRQRIQFDAKARGLIEFLYTIRQL